MAESFLTQILASIPQEGLLLGVVMAAIILLRSLRPRRSRPRWTPRDRVQQGANPDLSQPANQMDAIAGMGFQRRPLMNATEFRVFATVESAVGALNAGHRVMAQTSLGEVLRTEAPFEDARARRAFAAINSKRLDIAMFDRAGLLVLAVEVQGGGHYQSKTTFMRDAVKREALRRAGVEMLEITPDWDAARIRDALGHRLGAARAA